MKQLLGACLLLLSVNGTCQQITLDLSNDKFPTQSISPGTKEIVLKNTIVGRTYKVKPVFTEIVQDPPAALSLQETDEQSSAGSTDSLKRKSACPGGPDILASLKDITDGSERFKSEADIKKEYAKLEASIDGLTGECKAEALKKLNEANQATTLKSILNDVKLCSRIFLTIERYGKDENGKPKLEKIWNDTIESTCQQKPKKWFTYFGLTYQPNVLSNYPNYFAKQIPGTTDSFSIRKMNGDQKQFWENLSPTVMFTYLFGNMNKDLNWGITGIATSNFSTYAGGAGLSLVVGYNFNICTGVMFTQKSALKGIYNPGDTIKENLTFDQLHEKKWGPELFLSFGFRLDKKPKSTADVKNTDAPVTAPEKKAAKQQNAVQAEKKPNG